MTDAEKVVELRRCLLGITACFKSRVGGCDDVGCINDHHPSCLQYAEGVLARVDKEEVEYTLPEEIADRFKVYDVPPKETQ